MAVGISAFDRDSLVFLGVCEFASGHAPQELLKHSSMGISRVISGRENLNLTPTLSNISTLFHVDGRYILQ
jgi:hypothetical protein